MEKFEQMSDDIELIGTYISDIPDLKDYLVKVGRVRTSFYPEKYLYIFKDGKLVYYNHANRVAMHENEDYRRLAREAYEHFKEED